MKQLFDWLKAIGVVLVFIVVLYASWILAIFIAIVGLIVLVKTLTTLDQYDDEGEEIKD